MVETIQSESKKHSQKVADDKAAQGVLAKASLSQASQGWASQFEKTADKLPHKPKNFWQKLAPESKRGRVVFAAATAQVVSFSVVMLAGMAYKALSKIDPVSYKKVGLIGEVENAVGHYLANRNEPLQWLLANKPFKGFLDEDAYKLVEQAAKDGNAAYEIKSGAVVKFLVAGLANFISSNMWRNYLDDKLDINLGKKQVFMTQATDTVVGLGSMILVPALRPNDIASAKKGIEAGLVAFGVNPEKANNVSYSMMNVQVFDALGMMAGLGATLRRIEIQDQKKQLEELEKQISNSR